MNQAGYRDTETGEEGYLYSSFGDSKYLRHAVASAVSLRRYDQHRPICLISVSEHLDLLREAGADRLFDRLIPLDREHSSITGFKHNLHHYLPYERNLFLDSDMIWCRNPDPLWTSLSIYRFTITGEEISDPFFGTSKHAGVLLDILFRRRERTLRRFGLTYLNRVQSGMIYAADGELTRRVCEQAADYLSRIEETHFRSRLHEQGRTEESCEWSLAMAMSRLKIPVYPWLQAQNSPQLDFVESYTDFDPDFNKVECTYYSDRFVYDFRGLKTHWLRRFLTRLFSLIPGKGDRMTVTPYVLHFGWIHQKRPFYAFAETTWEQIFKKSLNRYEQQE